eukprot:gene4067-4739_t
MITLIYLKGTIPIIYQAVTYYIPIIIWVPESYPFSPPVVMLDPTPEMDVVKGHPHVSDTGICHHQYQAHWAWSCNIAQLLKYLCDIYSATPPLVAKQARPAPPPPQQPQQQPAPVENPPPYGSSPSSWASSHPPPSYAESVNVVSPPPVPPKTKPTVTPPSKETQERLLQEKKDQKERDDRAEALLQCTEKLQVLLSSFYESTAKEIEHYIAHNSSIDEKLQRLDSEKTVLNSDITAYQDLITGVTEKNEQLEKWLKEHEKEEGDDIDIDAHSEPKDPLSKQLLSLVSEDATIEDALYYLDKALHSNRITLEEYLKNVRSLSREQFMIRATVRKVHAHLSYNHQSSPTNHHNLIQPL